MERDSQDIIELKFVISELKLLASKYGNKTPTAKATSDSFCKYSLPCGVTVMLNPDGTPRIYKEGDNE